MTSIRWPLASLVAAIFALATALWSAPAAEILTAEVDGTTPIDVTVEQGATASFTIYVSASGSIRCTNTAANPSSAQVHTSYAVSNGGAVSSASFSSSMSFFAGAGSGTNCPITGQIPIPQLRDFKPSRCLPQRPLGRQHPSVTTPSSLARPRAELRCRTQTPQVQSWKITPPPLSSSMSSLRHRPLTPRLR